MAADDAPVIPELQSDSVPLFVPNVDGSEWTRYEARLGAGKVTIHDAEGREHSVEEIGRAFDAYYRTRREFGLVTMHPADKVAAEVLMGLRNEEAAP